MTVLAFVMFPRIPDLEVYLPSQLIALLIDTRLSPSRHFAPTDNLAISLSTSTSPFSRLAMSYNPRMSMARSSQPSSSQGRSKQEDGDAFMTLVRWTTKAQGYATDACAARQRDRRMHQRHWNKFHSARSPEAESSTNTEGLRMVR